MKEMTSLEAPLTKVDVDRVLAFTNPEVQMSLMGLSLRNFGFIISIRKLVFSGNRYLRGLSQCYFLRKNYDTWLAYMIELGVVPSEGVDIESSSSPQLRTEIYQTSRTLKSTTRCTLNDLWRLTVDERGPAHTQTITLPPTEGRLPIFPICWKQSG